ncbi:MAG TPA: hypothetical protein VLV18_03770 [Terriglobales bacterium]|nr:hypothetical protein [Terriglobales bacterium]
MRKTDGLVRYGLKTNFLRKKSWTYSVWTSEEAIEPFARTEPHATAIKKFAQWAAEGAVFSQWKNNDGKVDWKEANRRLQNPTFCYRK